MNRVLGRTAAGLLLSLFVVWVFACGVASMQQSDDYLEDFSEEKDWFSEKWNSGGFVEISVIEENVLGTWPCPSSEYGRLEVGHTVGIDLAFVSFKQGGAGLSLTNEEDGTTWGVEINPDGWYLIWRRVPNFNAEKQVYEYRTEFVKQRESREINKGLRTVNRLSLELVKRNVFIYCNGERITSLNTSMSGDLTINLTVSHFKGAPTTVRFDNLAVTFETSPSIGG